MEMSSGMEMEEEKTNYLAMARKHWIDILLISSCLVTCAYHRLGGKKGKGGDNDKPPIDYHRYEPFMQLNVPGANCRAYLMFIPRVLVCILLFIQEYPVALCKAIYKAIKMRCTIGLPSQILNKGGYPHDGSMHWPDGGYQAIAVHDQPLDKDKLEAAFASLAAEVNAPGMPFQWRCECLFVDVEEPVDWPSSGSFALHELNPHIKPGETHSDYWTRVGNKMFKARRLHVFNGPPGKPTTVLYQASCFPYDGSSNFNFYRELMSRYCGNEPNAVIQQPEIAAESAAKFDSSSFLWFVLKMPWNVARTIGGIKWGELRDKAWAGGNGSEAKITAMTFTKEESAKLYRGSKALGGSPFSAFTHASVKACHTVLGQGPQVIAQQASIQTRHYPLEGQDVAKRDLVGEWLVAPVQKLPICAEYDLAAAERGYQDFLDDLKDVGPKTRNTFMAKAYGEWNCGAAVFEMSPTYNDCSHCASRCLFFNNYGVRSTAEGAHLVGWYWNAPVWLGVNTININGATTTLVGSSRWGLEVVEALRDHIEATLREIMEHAPTGDVTA